MNGTFSGNDIIWYFWVTLLNWRNLVPPVSVPSASGISDLKVFTFMSYEGSELEAT